MAQFLRWTLGISPSRSSNRTTIRIQANLASPEAIGGYIYEVLSKCREAMSYSHPNYCDTGPIDKAEEGQKSINKNLVEIDSLFKALGDKLVSTRSGITEKRTKVEDLRQDIAAYQVHLNKYSRDASLETLENELFEQQYDHSMKRVAEFRKKREGIEAKIVHLKIDLALCEGNEYETEEYLKSLELFREKVKHQHEDKMSILRERIKLCREQKALLCSETTEAGFINIFKTKEALISLLSEVGDLKNDQEMLNGLMREQKNEKDFLRERNKEILQKIVDMQKQINDPDNLRLHMDPSCYTDDASVPKMWYRSPDFALAEVKACLQKAFQENDLKYVEQLDSTDIQENSDSDLLNCTPSSSEESISDSDAGEVPLNTWPI